MGPPTEERRHIPSVTAEQSLHSRMSKSPAPILYLSSIDISMPTGPGVNEREFVLTSARAWGDSCRYVLPRPVKTLEDALPLDRCRFTRPAGGKRFIPFILHSFGLLKGGLKETRAMPTGVLYFRMPPLPIAYWLLTRLTRRPYVIKHATLNAITALKEHPSALVRILAPIQRALLRSLFRKARALECVSEAHVAECQRFLNDDGSPILWIDNGVDTERFQPGNNLSLREILGVHEWFPVIGYIGTRPMERGAGAAIKALPSVLTSLPGAGLLVIGGMPSEVEDLRTLADNLGVANRIVLTGTIPFDQVPAHMQAIDLGVSLNWDPERRVSSELKVRQYLACGKIVIATEGGGNEFIRAHSLGALVDANDTAAVAKAIAEWAARLEKESDTLTGKNRKYVVAKLSLNAKNEERFRMLQSANHPHAAKA